MLELSFYYMSSRIKLGHQAWQQARYLLNRLAGLFRLSETQS